MMPAGYFRVDPPIPEYENYAPKDTKIECQACGQLWTTNRKMSVLTVIASMNLHTIFSCKGGRNPN